MKYPLLLVIILLFFGSCKQNSGEQKTAIPSPPPTYKFYHEVRLPTTPSANPPVLILLHGLGSNEKDLFSFAQYLDPRLLVIAARAPISMGNDRYSWFGLSSSDEGWKYDITAVNQVSVDLMIYIEQIIKNYKANRSKIFIGGFSQGAILSLATGLNNADKIAGVVCLSGRLYPELKPMISSNNNLNDLALFVSHGKQDKVLPYSDIVSDVAYLQELGLDPTVKYYDAEHTISQDNFRDMIAWISARLN